MSNEKGKAAPEAAPEAQNSSAGPSPELVAQVQARLAALNAAGSGAGASTSGSASGGSHLLSLDRKTKLQRKQKYAFWETQPVVQFDAKEEEQEDGLIDKPKTVADIKKEPYALPDSFEWCECDVSDAREVQEVYELLSLNYVEDDDAMFRFNYSAEFLQWALQPPGYRPEWHAGVRVKTSRKLVAFISAIPATVVAAGKQVPMVEINFLCVHKKLRSKRLAPVMIKEITRRVNLCDVWQAAYTAGVVLPKPVSVCRYWHRSLNPKKLIEVGFSTLQPRMTMARTIKLFKLPAEPATPGLRPMKASDAPAVAALLNSYLARYKLTQQFTPDEVEHWLTPRELVVDSFVVDAAPAAAANGSGGSSGGGVSDLVSFYTLPSTVLGHPEHKEIRAAYMFYTVAGSVPLPQLMQDAMSLAASKGYDVFNALDLMENATFLKDLKFGIGDGTLQYYLYNWRMRNTPVEAGETGLILL